MICRGSDKGGNSIESINYNRLLYDSRGSDKGGNSLRTLESVNEGNCKSDKGGNSIESVNVGCNCVYLTRVGLKREGTSLTIYCRLL
jgi:hypothetical protein